MAVKIFNPGQILLCVAARPLVDRRRLIRFFFHPKIIALQNRVMTLQRNSQGIKQTMLHTKLHPRLWHKRKSSVVTVIFLSQFHSGMHFLVKLRKLLVNLLKFFD